MKDNKNLVGHIHSQETLSKLSIATTNLFKTEQFQKNWSKGMTNLPNKSEIYFDSITPSSVVYTGNGKFFLTFKNGVIKNPDFVVEHSRKVIEIYGDYWHKDDNPQDLIEQYNLIGFDCLVLWEHEVYEDNVGERVISFLN